MAGEQSDLIIIRLFEAPRDVVWRAWTEPNRLKAWWGPKGFTAPLVNMDFREGGAYLNCMRAPDGKDYFSTGVYKEIVPQKKIVMSDSFADEDGNVVSAEYYGMKDFPLELMITVEFEEVDTASTRMTLTHTGLPLGEMRDQCRIGWNESFDKLEDVLA